MIEVLNNKFVWFGALLLVGALAYHLFNKKDKFTTDLESEYSEVLRADKYKVKGQY